MVGDPGHQDPEDEVMTCAVSTSIRDFDPGASIKIKNQHSRRGLRNRMGRGRDISGQLEGRVTQVRHTGQTNKKAAPLGHDGNIVPLATRLLFPIGRKSVNVRVPRST